MSIEYHQIGTIRSPFKDLEGMPIQPTGARGVKGSIEVDPEFKEGLKDLDGFSYIILLYHFHRSEGYSLSVKPFLDDETRGLFSTRAPKRPNPIGLSIVRVIEVRENTIYIQDVDVLDGTPLLDIKPYVPEFDKRDDCEIGWLDGRSKNVVDKRSDKRFA